MCMKAAEQPWTNFRMSWFVEHIDLSFSVNSAGDQSSPFTAPELLDGDVTSASDIYSLGVVFYQLMVGKLPFDSVLTFMTALGGELPETIYPAMC